ncbi:hypothetical protein BC833DRAFT_617317 [Globomyces pollinis-pini]|nr:hypothetical protein BC833DRAFT_617317 [Globomyces pollinis-pini]
MNFRTLIFAISALAAPTEVENSTPGLPQQQQTCIQNGGVWIEWEHRCRYPNIPNYEKEKRECIRRGGIWNDWEKKCDYRDPNRDRDNCIRNGGVWNAQTRECRFN